MTDLIKNYFARLDPHGTKPLFRQLEECFAALFEDLPDQTLLPVEREFATELNVNRATLRRALEPFVAKKMIERNRKGTVVRKQTAPPQRTECAETIPNSVLFGLDSPCQSQPVVLRVLLYEDSPDHIRFWHETAERFMCAHRGIRIKLEWLPHFEVPLSRMRDTMLDYLMRSECDLIQLPVVRSWTPEFMKHFARPGDSLRELYSDTEKYQTRKFCTTFPEMLDSCVPVYAGYRWLSTNRGILDACGVSPLDDPVDFAPWLGRVAHALPKDVFLLSNLGALEQMLGFSMEKTEDTVFRYASAALDLLKVFADLPELPLPREKSFFPDIRMFREQETALLYFTPIMQKFGGPYRFPFRKHLIFPPNGFYTHMACMSFGIHPETRRGEECEMFLRYLLSAETQRILARDFLMMPMNRAVWEEFADALEMPYDMVARFAETGREQPYFALKFGPCVLPLWERRSDWISGRISREEIVREVMAGIRFPDVATWENKPHDDGPPPAQDIHSKIKG